VGTATAVVLCLVVAIGALGWVNREASARAEADRQMQLELNGFELGMVNQEAGLRGYGLTGSQQFMEPYQLGREQVSRARRALDRSSLDDQGRRELSSLESAARSWQAYAETRRANLDAGRLASPPTVDDGKRLFDAYRAADEAFDQHLDLRARGALQSASDSSSFVAIATPALSALILLLLLFLGLLVVRSTLRPIAELGSAARAIAHGEPVSIPPPARRDELGDLAEALAAWQEGTSKRLGLAQAMVEVNSHLQLDECLELGIKRAADVLAAEEVTVLLAGEGGFEVTSDGRRTALDSISAWIEMGPGMQTLLNGRPTLSDYRESDWGLPRQSWAASKGFGPVLSVPMVSRGVTLGALTATRLVDRPAFDDADVQDAQIIAGPLAAAVHVAQVFEEKDDQARILAILNETARAASGVLDPVALAKVVTEKAGELLGGHHASLNWYEQSDGLLHVLAENHADSSAELSLPPGAGATGIAFETAQPVVVEDYQSWPGGDAGAVRRGLRSMVAVPLLASDRPVGTLSVHTDTPHRFSWQDVQLLGLLAAQVAPTMRAASLHSELARANEELTKVSHHKSRFLANMSHELRTPLNAILGFSELLLDDGEERGEPRKRRSYLGHIHSSGKHLLGLINEVLDLAKIEAGQVELNQAPFHLSGTIAAVVETVEPMAAQKRISIEQEQDWSGTVFADEAKVRQILLNLLSNAIKFTQEDGRVTVSSRAENGMLFLSVADNGIGIPQEAQQRIFDEFEQLESGRQLNHPGTGLGLALTRRLAELHGGRVWVDSAPERGSCFHVVLPLETPAAEDEEEGAADGAADGSKPLVLVVEDNLAAAALLSSTLRRAGYRAQVVRDGAEAVARAAELRPLAVTLDVLLPGQDGWDVLRSLKSSPGTRDIPVVVISVVDNRSLGIALGADDYLVKPLDRPALLGALTRFARAARKPPRRLRVLLVDEDAETRDRLEAELRTGFTVFKASGGQRGIELARKQKPDVVLVDLMMGRGSGFDVVVALKADLRTRDIPVLGMTGRELTESDKSRLNGRLDAVLAKGEEGRKHLLQRLQTLSEGLDGNLDGTHVSSRTGS
jgi:signal transduction histidine kinase/DNA-binding response OmpR family regulator/CHASE3 domain sensor protein